MAVVYVEVYSDVICPWCFLGRRRLARAAEILAGRHELAVAWKPFELNAWMPLEGMDRQEYQAHKNGTRGRTSTGPHPIIELARCEGIELNMDAITRTPNTFDAHRLIWLGGQQGRQIQVVDGLFKAYFQEGKDVGRQEVLVEVAGEAGLDADEVRAFLASDQGVAEVEQEEAVGQALGIDGVPFFLFEGKYGVTGAQPAEALADIIEQVVERESKGEPALASVTATGDACSADAPEQCQ